MIDIKSYFIALKATWVSRLVTGHISNWKLIPLKYFNATGKNWLVFSMNLDSTKSLKYLNKIPEFYREVVKCWNLSGGGQTKSPVTFIDIRKQIIWGNKHITFENKPIVFENWIKSDLIYVNDILDATKTLSSKFILEKLKFKSNWIAEFNIVNKSFPKNWINIIKAEIAVKSTVNIKRNKIIWKNNYIETSYLSNKMRYNSLLFSKIELTNG
jgi:hypothetical protein